MAAKPKLTPEQWADVRNHWERDPRDGYSWLVDELGLPVSAPGVRKTALRDGWAKASIQGGDAAPSRPAVPAQAKTRAKEPTKATSTKSVSKVSKVSENHQRETISETMSAGETMPLTTAEALERDPDQFGVLAQLTDMQEVFVREYMVDWNGTQAAIRAGYSAKSAGEIAYQLLQKPSVREAIETLASARARRLGIDADELMRMWAAVVTLDANEISQLRRVCCPYCWGADHQRQYTPSSLDAARLKHERERQRRMKADQNDDIGEFPAYTDAWYDKRKPPSEDCPECHGEGVVEVFFADTRNLSPAARLVYAGVKEGRDGIEVLTMSKEKAADNLARALGLFKEKETEVNINMVSGDELFRLYEDKMQQARERQALVLSERGIVIDADEDGPPAPGADEPEPEVSP
ncbi:terminase small subunit [Burkholderia sp. LMG 13014]|uniref:terminase small subunit n=1 Tax=Burkholderia sp. LMG 13014 TaxID=2709306 RepID=UPI00196346BF|nr:terminase small subunit [Burkholderia sp. LMG 13014]